MGTDWKTRHTTALATVQIASAAKQSAHEVAIVAMFKAWLMYADAHKRSLGSDVGDDGYAGELWYDIGRGILRLLNCETGALDCGTMDGLIRKAMSDAGFSPEQVDAL